MKPGPVRRFRPRRGGAGACWARACVWTTSVTCSPSVRRPDTARARRAARRRATGRRCFGITSGWIAGGDDGVRVDDRLADELLQRLPRRRLDRVEARADLRVGAGRRERVTAAAAGGREDRLARVLVAPPAAASARNFSYSLRLDDADGGSHRRVAEPAELRADERVLADPGRRDHERRLDPRDRVRLLPELRHPERVDHVERVQRQLDRPVDGEHELAGGDLARRRDTRTSRRTAARSRRCGAGSGRRRRSSRARPR